MKVTLKQLSEETGLSVSTISRALIGKGYVSEEARKAIDEAKQRLGYTPPSRENWHTTRLGEDCVMVLIGGIRNSISAEMVEYVSKGLESKNKRPFVVVTQFSPALERQYLRIAIDNGFFGVIMLTVMESAETVALLQECPIPVVFIGRYLPSINTDALHPDYYKMGYMAAEYLINHGHRRIAFIGGAKSSPITQDKLIGMLDRMQASHLDVPDELIMHNERMLYENGKTAARWLLGMDNPPTATFTTSSDVCIGMLDELANAGVEVPRRLSIFGCNDTPSSATCRVPLTLVCADYAAISAEAIRTLFRRKRNMNAPRSTMVFEPVLTERSSVAFPEV